MRPVATAVIEAVFVERTVSGVPGQLALEKASVSWGRPMIRPVVFVGLGIEAVQMNACGPSGRFVAQSVNALRRQRRAKLAGAAESAQGVALKLALGVIGGPA